MRSFTSSQYERNNRNNKYVKFCNDILFTLWDLREIDSLTDPSTELALIHTLIISKLHHIIVHESVPTLIEQKTELEKYKEIPSKDMFIFPSNTVRSSR